MKYPCRTVDTQEHDYLGVFHVTIENQIINT